jgi:predicted SPOUT superfamily RNA methylase MTH1
MRRHNQKLILAIPVSVLTDIPHLREKTIEIGFIGRAAAIFRVNEIIIFSDNPGAPNQKRDRNLFVTLLSYMETPQYLRKRLFKIKPELKYAGILPPLRTPHHPLERRARKLKTGEYREGVIIAVNERGSQVDVGVEHPILLSNKKLPINKRVTVIITKRGKLIEATLANFVNIKDYWGYRVTPSKHSLGKIVKSRNFDLVIATSKSGVSINQIKDQIAEHWRKARTILIAFGAPSRGLQEIVKKEDLFLDEIADFTINTIRCQGTETVRTKEALFASLALLNTLI